MRLRLIVAVAVLATRAYAQAPGDVPAAPVPLPPPTENPAVAQDTGEPTTGTARLGAYSDSDHTTVLRAMAAMAHSWGDWSFSANATADAVSSASIDVKSSPLGKVDVITSASGTASTSGGQMTDTRVQLVGSLGWKDSDGHAVNVSSAYAAEHDYTSESVGVNGSYDVLDRNATLLGGVSITDNQVESVLDPTLHRKMFAIGWSAGAARVLTRDDAIRLRYDGKASAGYQASPYRNVRFGDWTTTMATSGQILFGNTIGSADGLPEKVPDRRYSNALVFEWVHALGAGVGVHSAVRLGYDSWGIASVTPSIDLRVAQTSWRALLGYRYYRQTAASFFETRYMNDPSTYTYYTSDKELGRQDGHLGTLDLAKVVRESRTASESRLWLFAHVDLIHYNYPGFALLASRDSEFIEVGLSWEK